MKKLVPILIQAFLLQLLLLTPLFSRDYIWQYYNNGGDHDDNWIQEPVYDHERGRMSGNLTHYMNWHCPWSFIYTRYVPPTGQTAVFQDYGQQDVFITNDDTNFDPAHIRFDCWKSRFKINVSHDWTMSEASSGPGGVTNNCGIEQNFVVKDGATFTLAHSASARNKGKGDLIYTLGEEESSGIMVFRDTSTISNATYKLKNESILSLKDKASGSKANITAGDETIVNIKDQVTLDGTTINVTDEAICNCGDQCELVNTQFNVSKGGRTYFRDQSKIKGCHVDLKSGGRLLIDHPVELATLTSDADGIVYLGGDLTVDNSKDITMSGNFVDYGEGGRLEKKGVGDLLLLGNNESTRGIVISEGVLAAADGKSLGKGLLTFNGGELRAEEDMYIPQSIIVEKHSCIDTEAFVLMDGRIKGEAVLEKKGKGKIILNNAANDELLISEGIVEIPTNCEIKHIENRNHLIIAGNESGVFCGDVSGYGRVYKYDDSTVELKGDWTKYEGNYRAEGGVTVVNGEFGGSLRAVDYTHGDGKTTKGIVAGTGLIKDGLTVSDGGTVVPGNGRIGTLSVDKRFAVQGNGTFVALVNSAGQSNKLKANGETWIENGSILEIHSVDGQYDITKQHTIIESQNDLKGRFSKLGIDNGRIKTKLFYSKNALKIDFLKTFSSITKTPNQQVLASILESHQKSCQGLVNTVNILFNLPEPHTLVAFDAMVAEQYTNLLLSAEVANTQFIRRLYDPLRPMVTSTVSCVEDICCDVVETWLVGGAGQARFNKDGHVHGFKSNGYEVTLGAHKTFNSCNACSVLGVAFCYEQDRIHFKVPGNCDAQVLMAGLYGLYNPYDYYILGDLVFGYSKDRIKRRIPFFDNPRVKGHARIYDGLAYIEGGLNFGNDCFLFQPFVGFEGGFYQRQKIHEGGVSIYRVEIAKKLEGVANSRLGAHLTSQNLPLFAVSLDVAWQYRLVDNNYNIKETFIHFKKDIDPFTILGRKINRNSIDATVNVSTMMGDDWEVYAEASGQAWKRAYLYNVMGGVRVNW